METNKEEFLDEKNLVTNCFLVFIDSDPFFYDVFLENSTGFKYISLCKN